MGSEASVPERSNRGGLQAASTQPLTQKEVALLTPTGKSCTYKDSGELAYRLQQLQLLNYSIKVLSEELWKDPKDIDFPRLHQTAMSYKDVDGKPTSGYPWALLANDTDSFPALESSVNRFKEFEEYMSKNTAAPKADLKKQMEYFMIIFVRMRDRLLDIMAESCRM